MTLLSTRSALFVLALLLLNDRVTVTSPRHRNAPVSQAAESTTLTIGEQSAVPGAPVVVPLTLAVPDAVKAGSIEVRVTFPKALLTFVKLEPSGLALGVFATVDAVVEKGPDAASSTLRATIATPASGEERKAFSAGVLAYLGFTIAKTAKPLTSIPLKVATVVRATDGDGRPLPRVVAVNGKVTVTSPPVISCFFYMH